jgi:hypothetical protein
MIITVRLYFLAVSLLSFFVMLASERGDVQGYNRDTAICRLLANETLHNRLRESMDEHKINTTVTMDTLRLVHPAWRDVIDRKRTEILKTLPASFFNQQKLKSTLLINRFNEWCGVTKPAICDNWVIVFGNSSHWHAWYVERTSRRYLDVQTEKWYEKPSILSISIQGRSSFYIPDCYVVPELAQLRTYTVPLSFLPFSVQLLKKTCPLLLEQAKEIFTERGCVPALAEYKTNIDLDDPQWQNLRFIVSEKCSLKEIFDDRRRYEAERERCTRCRPDAPTEVCKERFERMFELAKEEQFADRFKNRIILSFVLDHLSHRCTGGIIDTLPYEIIIDAYGVITIKPKDKASAKKIEFSPDYGTKRVNDIPVEGYDDFWRAQQERVLKMAQNIIYKDGFLYHYIAKIGAEQNRLKINFIDCNANSI